MINNHTSFTDILCILNFFVWMSFSPNEFCIRHKCCHKQNHIADHTRQIYLLNVATILQQDVRILKYTYFVSVQRFFLYSFLEDHNLFHQLVRNVRHFAFTKCGSCVCFEKHFVFILECTWRVQSLSRIVAYWYWCVDRSASDG